MRREDSSLSFLRLSFDQKICRIRSGSWKPYEEVTVDVDTGTLGNRQCAIRRQERNHVEMSGAADGEDSSCLRFQSCLAWIQFEVATATKGSAVVTHIYIEDRPHAGKTALGLRE
jgi:predicted membrane GTPase involved in stress response